MRKCGYDLAGLSLHGYCPECGLHFNIGSGEGLVPTGKARLQRNSDLIIRLLGAIFLATVALMVLVCGGVSMLLSADPLPVLITAVLVALVLGFGRWSAFSVGGGNSPRQPTGAVNSGYAEGGHASMVQVDGRWPEQGGICRLYLFVLFRLFRTFRVILKRTFEKSLKREGDGT